MRWRLPRPATRRGSLSTDPRRLVRLRTPWPWFNVALAAPENARMSDTDLEAFRAEARTWLEANFPPALKGQAALAAGEGPRSTDPALSKWRKAIGEKGWATPTWPKQYGGGGLSVAEARVLNQ